MELPTYVTLEEPACRYRMATVADSLAAINPNSPLAAELRRTSADLSNRGPDALADLEARAPTPALATLAFNLRVYLRAGGEQAALMADAAARLQRIIAGRNNARAKASGVCDDVLTNAAGRVALYEDVGYVQYADQVPYETARRYANLNTHYLDRYDIDVEVVDIIVDDARDTVAVRVAADLAPLFPDFGLPLDHTVVREGEALIWMRALEY